MNNLTVFNNDIIPVYTTAAGEKVVIGRELHERLKIATDYKDWFPPVSYTHLKEGVKPEAVEDAVLLAMHDVEKSGDELDEDAVAEDVYKRQTKGYSGRTIRGRGEL